MKKIIKAISTLCCALTIGVNAAEETKVKVPVAVKSEEQIKLNETKSLTLVEAFKNGKVKGTIGSYGEYTDFNHGGDKTDFGWLTGYLELKYETARWNNLKLGAKFVAHEQLADNSELSGKQYDKDIEDKVGLAELYLDYAFSEKFTIRLGRFNHKKLTHIDDVQSQGGYLQFKEIQNLDIVIGAISKFAEMDYDDMETFSRDSESQDLSSDKYGDSDDLLWFAEVTYKLGLVELNPFLYYQGGYATVYGMDTVFEGNVAESTKLGLNIYAFGVDADTSSGSKFAGKNDGYGFNLEPFVKVSDWKLSVGWAGLGGSREGSVNKPAWFRDYLMGFDQDKYYKEQGINALFAKIAWKKGNWKAQIYYGHFTYDDYTTTGKDQYSACELETQVTYKITKNLDLNLRGFNIAYDQESKDDYQKVETRLRYKF
ncbi:MAG: hypothetical protein KAG98_05735 [Lentisphaeria bacterium]|nr:hypothetical protein [Lentisphaeria bacterium]